MPNSLQLSLVIPAYNEEARITDTLQTVAAYLHRQSFASEVLVVDDGSRDATADIVRLHMPIFAEHGIPLRLLSNSGNYGKGYSIRHGFLEAMGEIVLFSDADLSAPITETPKLITPIMAGDCDVTFGSRALRDSFIGKHQTWSRELAGRTFNRLTRLTTGLRFSDTQCGFKAFRRTLLRPVFEQQRTVGFGFDVEILYLATKRRARLREIPIEWHHAEGSKVSLWRGIKAFGDILSIRLRDIRGVYKIPAIEPIPKSCPPGKKSAA